MAQTACHEALLPGPAKLQNLSLRTIAEEQKSQKTVKRNNFFFSPLKMGRHY